MKQVSKCVDCGCITTFEPVMVSGFIYNACKQPKTVTRQLKYLANFLFLESLLPKHFEAFQCNQCGEIYQVIPDCNKTLYYVSFEALSIEACKVIAEYENGTCVVLFGNCQYGVNVEKDVCWFDDRQSAVSALVDCTLLKGQSLEVLRGIV